MLQVIFISYVLVVIFLSLIPASGMGGVEYMDKAAHASAYGFMGILAYISFETLGKRMIIFIFMFLLGISLEFLQLLVPGRSASVYDALANTTGLVLSFLLCWTYSLIPNTAPQDAAKVRD